jgi:tetratricopeptide (TPR) repeat protein
VSEETAGADSGVSGIEAAGALGVDPVAIALAIGAASREKADAFLEKQTAFLDHQSALIADQRHHLHEQLKQLHLDIFEKWLGASLRLATLCVGIGVISAIALMVWNAHEAEGLIIEPFSVPPDMASRGISGQVVASQMLDQLTTMQNITQSSRPQKSFTNSWSGDLKVEIPDTGISIGEVYRFLRRWLGRETHVSGEVTRAATGIAITARTDGNSGTAVKGGEADLDRLVVESAEQIYRVTQPDRYARYLFLPRPGLLTPDFDAAGTILNQMIQTASPTEKPWAWYGLGIMRRYKGDYRAASDAFRQAVATGSNFNLPNASLAFAEAQLGQFESALVAAQHAQLMLDHNPEREINPGFIATITSENLYWLAFVVGDYRRAAEIAKSGVQQARPNSLAPRELFYDKVLYSLSLEHDLPAYQAYWNAMGSPETTLDVTNRLLTRFRAEVALEHYQTASDLSAEVENNAAELKVAPYFKEIFETQLLPASALAKAMTGKTTEAERLISTSPLDCYDCVRIRALIAGEIGQHGGADYWFARAVHDAPSVPSAYADWGRSFLARGQPDAAIEKFKQSSQKGPHFADPLEGWGEALMAKNQSHLALAKFAEAEKYAPNWGRLHLKWGEALAYTGRKDEARAEYQKASTLDLTVADKAELARQMRS